MADDLPETSANNANRSPRDSSSGFRLRRVILLETVFVALIGFFAWGLAWEMGFFKTGLVVAIIIWLTVSPAIEIASVMKYRESQKK